MPSSRSTAKLLKGSCPRTSSSRWNSADEDDVSLLDIAQIGQVLMNLATNARDAMPNGGRSHHHHRSGHPRRGVQEDSRVREAGQYALISVSDTGVGMDERPMARIFDPFFTTKEVGKGTGLGLSSVYGIVKQHGGYITVDEHALLKGTTFDIYLPLVDTRTATAAVGRRRGQGRFRDDPRRRRRRRT